MSPTDIFLGHSQAAINLSNCKKEYFTMFVFHLSINLFVYPPCSLPYVYINTSIWTIIHPSIHPSADALLFMKYYNSIDLLITILYKYLLMKSNILVSKYFIILYISFYEKVSLTNSFLCKCLIFHLKSQ